MEFQQLFKILKDDVIKVLHSISQQIWKTQQWPQDWKRSILILIPKKCSTKECSNHCTIALIFMVKASAYNAGDLGLIPGPGRSPGEGNDNPLQYSCLENPINGEAWWTTIHEVTESWTQPSNFTSFSFHA